MTDAAEKLALSYAEYARREETSPEKHQYLDGEIFAMSGGTPEHAELGANVGRLLGNQLEGRKCRVYSSDLRVRAASMRFGTYPDVTVVCGALERSAEDANSVTNPTVIVEVLSDSTEAFDRGDKFAYYRTLSSLREYVLVSQKQALIEVFAHDGEGRWVLTVAGPGERLELASIGCTLEVDAVYGDMFGESA
jgi:Uma2 family endonuclease